MNANYIDGYRKQNAYIATQGSLPETFGDFWRMIWEQRSATVVMMTKLEERSRVRINIYFLPLKIFPHVFPVLHILFCSASNLSLSFDFPTDTNCEWATTTLIKPFFNILPNLSNRSFSCVTMCVIAKRKKQEVLKVDNMIRENKYYLDPLSKTHIEQEHSDFGGEFHQYVLTSIFSAFSFSQSAM